jgi:hypothetical protein
VEELRVCEDMDRNIIALILENQRATYQLRLAQIVNMNAHVNGNVK